MHNRYTNPLHNIMTGTQVTYTTLGRIHKSLTQHYDGYTSHSHNIITHAQITCKNHLRTNHLGYTNHLHKSLAQQHHRYTILSHSSYSHCISLRRIRWVSLHVHLVSHWEESSFSDVTFAVVGDKLLCCQYGGDVSIIPLQYSLKMECFLPM